MVRASQSGGKWQVSTSGGNQPRWRPDGKEIFYVSPPPDARLMAAAVGAEGETITVGAPHAAVCVSDRPISPAATIRSLLTACGFCSTCRRPSKPAPTPITVVVNWTARVEKESRLWGVRLRTSGPESGASSLEVFMDSTIDRRGFLEGWRRSGWRACPTPRISRKAQSLLLDGPAHDRRGSPVTGARRIRRAPGLPPHDGSEPG